MRRSSQFLKILPRAMTEEAYFFWRNGRDTAQIAQLLEVSESAVYNSLAQRRNKARPSAPPVKKNERGDA